MRDILSEIIISMRSNKKRIALTGFSIGWGIFILIVLLGCGNGLINGTMKNIGNDADNVLSISAGKTIVRHEGLPIGRQIDFDDSDIRALKTHFPDNIIEITPSVTQTLTVSSTTKHISTPLSGKKPGYMERAGAHLVAGRDINENDIACRNKVCIIARRTQQILFPDNPNPIKCHVQIGPSSFMIVGIYENDNSYNTYQMVYAPATTVSTIFWPDGHFRYMQIELKGVSTTEENNELISNITNLLAARHHCSPSDKSALVAKNYFEQVNRITTMLGAVNVFIWIIGLATLLGGIVGVANIMLITVKERTKELGIRKAMGASRTNIITLVILESIFIILLFGYIGMMLGIGVTKLMDYMIVKFNMDGSFSDPTVGLNTILAVTSVMVIAGLIAGYIPARKAVSTKLVNALSS